MKNAPIEELTRHFRYDPKTGHLFWSFRLPGRKMDSECGTVWQVEENRKKGGSYKRSYRYVGFLGQTLPAHRIVWQINYGPIPEGMIVDHKDGDGLNNRLENLRLIKASDNSKNMATPVSNTSGVMGVFWRETRKKWEARITHKGRVHFLGQFDNKGDAMAARREAEKRFGFFYRHGRITTPDRKPMRFFHMP